MKPIINQRNNDSTTKGKMKSKSCNPTTSTMVTSSLRTQVQRTLIEFHSACKHSIIDEINIYCHIKSSRLQSIARSLNTSHHKEEISSTSSPYGSITQQPRQQEHGKARGTGSRKGDDLILETSHSSPNPKQRKDSIDQKQQANNDISNKDRSWTIILHDLSHLTPFMTEEEHDLVCRLISICFLSYFLPFTSISRKRTSDCIENKPLNNQRLYTERKSLLHSVIHYEFASLEEILHDSLQYQNLTLPSNHPYTLMHNDLLLSYMDFLQNGVGPFLSSRPLSIHIEYLNFESNTTTQTSTSGVIDLLHVLSMAIAPDITQQYQESCFKHDPVNDSYCFYMFAKALLSSVHASHFHLSYIQRAELVAILAHNLVLPELPETHQIIYSPILDPKVQALLQGGLPHLRASLQTFILCALSNDDIRNAKKALVGIAIYCNDKLLVCEEMTSLISSLTNDRGGGIHNKRCCQRHDGKSTTKSSRQREKQQHFDQYSRIKREQSRTFNRDGDLCLHCANGTLLKDLIIRYNGSRYYADESFTRQTLAEITGAVGVLLGSITTDKHLIETDEENMSRILSLPLSCQISALLDCARVLFYFLYNEASDGVYSSTSEQTVIETTQNSLNEERQLEEAMKDALIECAIQLLCSHSSCINSSASSLLTLAFSYSDHSSFDRYLPSLIGAIKAVLSGPCINSRFQDLLYSISRIFPSFALTVLPIYITELSHEIEVAKTNNNDPSKGENLMRSICSIALAQPYTLQKYVDTLKKVEDANVVKHTISILLSFKLAHHFSDDVKVKETTLIIKKLLLNITDPWAHYQIMRHAFCTSNFSTAKDIIQDQLLKLTSQPSSFLWLTILSKVAQVEDIISQQGSTAIPVVLPILDSCINYTRSLKQIRKQNAQSDTENAQIPLGFFQTELLCLRKDFLDICLCARGICEQISLTNVAFRSGTRSFLHQKNIANCFYMLASKYSKLYTQLGLVYCQQTKTTLRSLFALCRFMGELVTKVFREAFNNRELSPLIKCHQIDEVMWPKGDRLHPLCKFLKKLRENLIEPWKDPTVQPSVRAKVFLQIMDIVLKNPVPFPRGFMSLKCIPLSYLHLSGNPTVCLGDPTKADILEPLSQTDSEVLIIQPDIPFTVNVNGVIPMDYLQKVDILFSQVVIGYTISCDGNLNKDEDVDEQTTNVNLSVDDPLVYDSGNVGLPCPLLPKGPFITDSGREIFGPKFFSSICAEGIHNEGYYEMKVTVSVRDIRYGDYNLSFPYRNQIIYLCVTSNTPGGE